MFRESTKTNRHFKELNSAFGWFLFLERVAETKSVLDPNKKPLRAAKEANLIETLLVLDAKEAKAQAELLTAEENAKK